MKIYDISVPLGKGTPIYEGDPTIDIIIKKSMEKGDSANITQLSMGAHSGTHIDAPYHFCPDGKHIDELDLSAFLGPCQVIEAKARGGLVTLDELSSAVKPGTERVLIKTPNSTALWSKSEFERGFVSLSLEAAKWIVNRGLRLVGIDYLSIERFHSKDHAVHKELLENSVAIIEGLDLREVPSGNYDLIALPLRIMDGDGSPTRAILTRRD